MSNTISIELTTTNQRLGETLSLFTPDNFNAVPFEGSWTAGQVAEHIYKSLEHAPNLLNGGWKPPGRDPAQMVQQLRDMFLNFDTKMKSPDFILPSAERKDLATLSKQLEKVLAAVAGLAATVDLDVIMLGFEFPNMGKVSRLEFVNFLSVHTQRHIHQLQNINKKLQTVN